MSSTEIENSDEPDLNSDGPVLNSDELDFCWGKKRGVGGKNRELQFYESFTYDGVEYSLHDCVYMYTKQNGQCPYIGKLIKIWETGGKSKKIKVQWFFRASEISHWLRTYNLEASVNELFFATGEGKGLANVNPLEAIAGKCSVVCISRDSRNPQPLAEHLQMADYVFYRTFDVGQCSISDHFEDRVGGLEVRYLFNEQETEMITGPNIGLKPKEEDNRITVVFEETLQLSGEKKPLVVESIRKGGDPNQLVAKDGVEANYLLVKDDPSDGLEKEQVEDTIVPSNQAKVKHSSEPANETKVREISKCNPHNLDGRSFEKLKPDKNAIVTKGKVLMKGDQSTSSREGLKMSTVDSFKEKRKSNTEKGVVGVNYTKLEKDSSYLDDRPPKIPKVEGLVKFSEVKKKNHPDVSVNDAKVIVAKAVIKDKPFTSIPGDLNISDTGKDLVGFKDAKFDNVSGLDDRPSKKQKIENVVKLSKVEKKGKPSDGGEVKDNNQMDNPSDGGDVKGCLVVGSSVDNKREVMLAQNSTSPDDGPSKEKSNTKINKFTKTLSGLETINTKEILEQKVHHENMSEHSKNSSKLDVGPPVNMSKHTKSLQEDPSNGVRDSKIKEHTKDSFGLGKGPSKERLDAKASVSRNSSFVMDKGPFGADVGKIYEVTQRPNSDCLQGKGTWFTYSPWENMNVAHDEGKMILLQNLDPEFTSGEVEDILWSAFKETCRVKMVQHTTFSSPHYGQALVILKTREAAERVVGKLNDGCLLISNQRALVGSIVNLPQLIGKQCNFVGHLFIDKIKLQMAREKKDALSTAHYSQPNTIEYELAMEWCLLQSRYGLAWESLFKCQGAEFSKCMSNFKSNTRSNK